MKIYWRLKEKNTYFAAIELKRVIPELKNVNIDSLDDHLRGSDLEFYYREKKSVPLLVRLTLPVAIVLWILLFVTMPLKFIITGKWGYNIVWFMNWYNALGL